jgi:hypothetical protein
MVTKPENISLIVGFFLLVILTASLAGCTNSSPATNYPATTPAQLTPTSIVPSPEIAKPPITQNQQQRSPVKLSINSAKKMMRLGKSNPKPGDIFLVLNVTVENRNVDQGYILGNRSITLKDSNGNVANLELDSRPEIQKELENPIRPQTKLEINETITGQILFGIPDSANYNLNMMGKGGTEVLTSQPINFNNPLTTDKSASITINSAEKLNSVNYSGTPQFPMPGHIFLLLNVTIKNNGIKEGFVFREESTNLQDLKGGEFILHPLNSGTNMRDNLENALVPSTSISQNETLNGQIIFGIADSTKYRLNLLDEDNAILVSETIDLE